MEPQRKETEQNLAQLFYNFLDSGLQGRFEEAFSLVTEGYMGVGMEEQGIVHSKEEARRVLQSDWKMSYD